MAKGLPKAIIKKYGISKKAWAVFRGRKVNKRRTTKRNVVGVSKVAKRRRYTRKRSRRRKAKLPMETAVALIAIPFTPSYTGGPSIIDSAQKGNYKQVAHDLVNGFLGLNIATGKTNVMAALNPFDFGHARYSKILFWSGVASKVRKKVVRIPFDKVPLIGKYIS